MLVLAVGLGPAPGDTGGFADTSGHWVSTQGYIGPAVGDATSIAGRAIPF